MNREELLRESVAFVEKNGSSKLNQFLENQSDPLLITQLYGDLSNHYYWKKKDLASSLLFGKSGIKFGIVESGKVSEENEDLAYQLKSVVKGLYYNIASFTWPGWNEVGITISDSELKVGFEAAKSNLNYAEELKKGEIPFSRAHWMLGGHYLAMKDYSNAMDHYNHSAKHARSGNSRGEELLALGFMKLVETLSGVKKLEVTLEAITEELSEIEDGKYFVEQIKTATKVFEKVED